MREVAELKDILVADADIGVAAGAAAASAVQQAYVYLPCTTSAVIVNDATYDNCNGTWYNRATRAAPSTMW